MKESDQRFMQQALRLARRGAGHVLPNPMVGAVLVKDGKIIASGYHRRYGDAHAEIEALQRAGEAARGAVLYVTLEPCSHFGKTPPCTRAIVEAGVAKVVAAMQDPNPRVAGGGFRYLRQHGVEVERGVLEAEAVALNRAFVKYIQTGTPYVAAKIAQTLDGRIADSRQASKWISSEPARKLVHRWRAEANAVLVGIGTVLADNPRLTVRAVSGKQPFRVVLDRELRIPHRSALLSDEHAGQTIVFAQATDENFERAKRIEASGARVVLLPLQEGRLPLTRVLDELGRRNIAQVLVEGGAAIFSTFLRERLVDHLAIFIAGRLFGDGIPAVTLPGYSAQAPLLFRQSRWRRVGPDMLFEGEPAWDAQPS